MPPIRLGMKKIVRKTLVPFSPLVRASAMAKASTLIRIEDRMANRTVSQKACEKVSSAKTLA